LSVIVGSLGTLALLPALSGLKRGPSVLQRSATFIALISYSMYLLNLSVIIFHVMPPLSHLLKIDDNGKLWMALTQYALYWFLTITLSWLLYRFYEVRMTMLREKFSRRE
jgi:peptidoglycan/LPS O-acetylase OafA/YrhL